MKALAYQIALIAVTWLIVGFGFGAWYERRRWHRMFERQYGMNKAADPLPSIDPTKPIHVPNEWVDWPGKAEGKPKPSITWLN